MWAVGLLTAAVAFGTTWLVTPWVVRLAHRWGAVDAPGPRKVHAIPTPRVGGAAVFVGFVAALIVASFATGYALNEGHPRLGYWSVLAACAAGMLVLGIVDDTRGVSFQGKFAVQLVAASAVWLAGFRVEILGFPSAAAGGIELAWLSFPFTVLWIVGITNAFNLIDGLDGLAAGTALISTTTVAAIAIQGERVAVSAIAVALVGSLLGFLRYNFNPATIFLGDSGSMFLGFTLAVISIHGSQKNVTAVAVLVPLLLVGYPLLDTSLAVVRRLNSIRSDANGRGIGYVARNAHRVFLPDRGHLHHLLLDLGVSHRRAVLTLYACALAFAFGAFALVVSNSLAVGLVVAGTLAGLTLLFIAFVIARARVARRRESQRCGRRCRTAERPGRLGRGLRRALMRTTSSPHPGLPPPTILVAALALAAGVLAQGQALDEPPRGLQWGPVVFTPSVLFGYSYDSNVFQQSEILAPEADAVMSVEPQLQILVPFSNSAFRLTDRFRWRDYAETAQTQGKTSNELEAALDLNFSSFDTLEIGGLRVDGVAETLVFDPGGEVVFSGESYRSYDAHVGLNRDEPGKRGYRVEAGRQALRFNESASVSFFDYRGFYGEASYLEPLRSSMNLSVSYRGDRFEHFRAGEAETDEAPFRTERGDAFYVGVEGRLASHRPYSMRIGWQELKFGSSPAPDFKGLVFNGNIALTGGRKTVLTVGLDRTPYRSFFFDNNFYVFDDVRATIAHRFWRASELGASVTLGRLSYDDPVPPPDPQAGLVRVDKTIWIDAYANFAVRDLVVFRVNFRRTRRESNFDAGIFDQNVFFGGFVLGWF